jgi:phosphoglycerate dehydrogenase-like enzyme
MFKVGLTRDFLTPEGNLVYKNIGLDILDREPNIQYEFLKENRSPVTPDMIAGYNSIISLTPLYDSKSFKGISDLYAICRFGVGYDMVDIEACNKANIIVTITRGAVNHSVAESVISWMLALSHRIFEKDKLVREGKWLERSNYMGTELRGKTLGIIGIGGIGGRLVKMLETFNMNTIIAYDPHADKSRTTSLGVQLVDIKTLMKKADFVSVNCPLTKETRNLIGLTELQLLKKEAYIINTARGGIINSEALTEVLRNNSIAGYATDVFDHEPPFLDDPLFKLKNVILAPHSIAWTHELFEEIGRTVCNQVVQISKGKIPSHIVNVEVLKNNLFQY